MSAIVSIPKFLISLANVAKGNQVSLKEFNAKKKAKAQRAKAYAKQVDEKAKADSKQAKADAKQAKANAKQANIEAKALAKQTKLEAKQAKALAKQAKLEAKQTKALAKQTKLEAKQTKALAKQTMDQAKELATVELNTPNKTIDNSIKQEQLSAPTKTRSTGSRKVGARSSSKKNNKIDTTDRVDIIRNLCDQSDFCYNGQVSVEITA